MILTTYIGSSVYTVTVEIGLETGVDRDGASVGGSLTVGFSWSYEKPDIVIHDRSDYDLELAKWWNDIDEAKGVGADTVRLKPGAFIRLPQKPGTYLWESVYLGQWAKQNCILFWCSWELSGYEGVAVTWGVVGT